MAAESNGRPVESSQKGMNGSANPPRSKPVKTAKGFSLFSTISRLLTWYSIITILIRCPATSNLLTDASPKICKPYFQLRSVVAPHLEPYYHTYAAPYVDAAQPYYDTLDKRIITPAKALGLKYGAPRVAQAQAFGQAQWDMTLQPQVLKYQGIVKEKYDQTLGPHVEKAFAAAGPYYDLAKTNALQTYYEFILPTYTTIEPYAIQGYGVANDFAFNTAIPYSQWAWTTATVFLDRTVWPKLRILYGENVEPQLVRIGERLGRYRDGKKLKAVIDEVDSTSSASAATESFSSISSSVASAHSTSPPVPGVTHEPQLSEQEAKAKDAIANAQIVVAKDLKTWQEKFAKAADEGSDELEERITEITDRLVQNQAQGVGKALIIQLEETVKSSLQTLKKSIISIVKDAKDIETSEDALNAAVRKAGVAIKEKAQAVRTWRQSYDREANSLVSQSAETTFEILDNIRDLGLQEIGMRWAWTDGITHKDWKKYHQLKNKFDEWRTDVEKVLTEHPGLEKARAASEEVESQAMTTAEDAAKELARLKETGRWKISAGDSSDDFSTKTMPTAAAVVAKKVAEKVSELSEAMAPTSQGIVESVVSIASSIAASQVENVQSAVSSASASIVGTPQGSAESVISVGSSIASSLNSIIGTSQGTVESAASVAKASESSIMDQVSSSVLGTPQGSVESGNSLSENASSSIVGKEPESASSLSDAASSSISSGHSKLSKGVLNASASPSPATSSVASSLSKGSTSASSSISSAVFASSTGPKKVWGGAMAAEVPARQIVSEDIVDDSDATRITNSIAAKATEAYSAALSRASDNYAHARSVISAQISGEPKPYHQEILGSLETAYSDSVAAARARLQDAVSAASTVVYGTPTPAYQSVWESLSSAAQSRLSDGLSAASARYEEGKSYVASLNAPAPTQQKLLDQIQEQYYAGVGMAHARYSDFSNAASSAVMPTKTPWTESAASAASENWEALITKASSQIYGAPTPYFITQRPFSEAMAYAAQATDGVASQYSAIQSLISEVVSGKEPDFIESVYNRFSSVLTPPPAVEAILDSASSRVNEAVEAASIQFYGTTTGYAEAAQSSITDAASSAQKAISEAIWGTETGTYESATSAAAERYASATAAVSRVIYGQEQGVVESAQSRLSAAVESARVKLADFAASAGEGANEYIKQASEGMEDFASGVSSVIASAKPSAKDEL